MHARVELIQTGGCHISRVRIVEIGTPPAAQSWPMLLHGGLVPIGRRRGREEYTRTEEVQTKKGQLNRRRLGSQKGVRPGNIGEPRFCLNGDGTVTGP